jgi:hypothetical protein
VLKVLKTNIKTHAILAIWPLLLAVIVTIVWGESKFKDYAIAANTGYFAGSLLDWGGTNFRILFNKRNQILSFWILKVSFLALIAFILSFFLDFTSELAFMVAIFSNPLWVYVDIGEQATYNKFLLYSRIVCLALLFTPGFITLVPIAFILFNIILTYKLKKYFEYESFKYITENSIFYIKHGLSFFLSKISTSAWMYLPLLILSTKTDSALLPYLDKLYQMAVTATVPFVLTQLKLGNFLSRKIMIVTGLTLIIFNLFPIIFSNYGSEEIILFYAALSFLLIYLSVFGQGWVLPEKTIWINCVYFFTTLITLFVWQYYNSNIYALVGLFFVINFLIRIRVS